jgi:Tol biopolymer transport system component
VPGDSNGQGDIFVRDLRRRTTSLVSLTSDGALARGDSDQLRVSSITARGRLVAFESEATNLVPQDTNGRKDIFVRDRKKGRTYRVSVGAGQVQANGLSTLPLISANGRYVAFTSAASNLVPGDTNREFDVFVRDLKEGRTRRVSVNSRGVQADMASIASSISANGRYVGFQSEATNLVPGDTNGFGDVFVRDVLEGTTTRVSVSTGGAQADSNSFEPSLSADGRCVVFGSYAENLVPGDTNATTDVFLHNLATGTTRLVSLTSAGVESQGDGFTINGKLSPNGRYVGFSSGASDFVLGDTNESYDIFVRDLRRCC